MSEDLSAKFEMVAQRILEAVDEDKSTIMVRIEALGGNGGS